MIAKTPGGPHLETSSARFFWRDAGGNVRTIEIEVVPSREGSSARVHVAGSQGVELLAVPALVLSNNPGPGGPGAKKPERETPVPGPNTADPFGFANRKD